MEKFRRLLFMLATFMLAFAQISCETDPTATDDNSNNNSNNNDGSRSVSVSGVTQKGPFITGAQITISELDENLTSTGKSFQAQITDNLGSFSTDFNTTGSYGEYIASGYYFDETTNTLSSGALTLRALSEIGTDVNINILTTLQIDRAKALINSGNSFDQAISQSHKEVLTLFGVESSDIESFDNMDISEEGESNLILLAISATLQQGRSVAEMSELISYFSLDLADNGVVDTQSLIDAFMSSAVDVDTQSVISNLQSRYISSGHSVTIADFSTYLEDMWEEKSYTVKFNTNEGSLVDEQTITFNNPRASRPTTTRTGYTFGGWYSDQLLTQEWNFDTVVTSDIDLYALWYENPTVSFETGVGPAISSQTITYNTTISEPSTSLTGYTFGGWYTDTTYNTLYNFTTPITSDVKIYALWHENPTVSFETGDGSAVSSQTITYNTTISEPSTSLTGYTLDGWYTTSNTKWDFSNDLVTATITLTAKWTINTYTVIFNSNGGTEVTALSAQYLGTISAPTAPTKEGYTFVGWYEDASFENEWDFSTLLTENITLYAKWVATDGGDIPDMGYNEAW